MLSSMRLSKFHPVNGAPNIDVAFELSWLLPYLVTLFNEPR
jgi:hypothetical protein